MNAFDVVALLAGAVLVGSVVTLLSLGERWVDSKMLSARNKTQTVMKVTLLLSGMAGLGIVVGSWLCGG